MVFYIKLNMKEVKKVSEVIQLNQNVEYALTVNGNAKQLNKQQTTSFADILANVNNPNSNVIQNQCVDNTTNALNLGSILEVDQMSLQQLISGSQNEDEIINEIVNLMASLLNNTSTDISSINTEFQEKISQLITQGNALLEAKQQGNSEARLMNDFISQFEDVMTEIDQNTLLKNTIHLSKSFIQADSNFTQASDQLSFREQIYAFIRQIDQKNYSDKEADAKVNVKLEQVNQMIEPNGNDSKEQNLSHNKQNPDSTIQSSLHNEQDETNNLNSFDSQLMVTSEGLSSMDRLSSHLELNQMANPMIRNMDEILELFNKEAFKLENLEKSMIEVQLHPRELGQMKIKLEMVQGLLSGKIIVDNVNAKAALTQNMNQIVDQITDQGVAIGNLDVDIGGQLNQQNDNDQIFDDDLLGSGSSRQKQADLALVHETNTKINLYERMLGTTFSTLA